MIEMIASLALAATPTSAPTDADTWHLMRRGPICTIEAVSNRQTFVRIELDAEHGRYFMSVSALVWNDVEDGKTYRLGFAMAGYPPPRIFNATGVKDVASPRSIVLFMLPARLDDRWFLEELARAKSLTLDLDGSVVTIDTGGLRDALDRLSFCRKEWVVKIDGERAARKAAARRERSR